MKTVCCTICPNCCTIEIDEISLEGKGNLCPRGLEFAKHEIKDPQRTVTTLVKTTFKNFPVLPCKTNKAISKDKIFDVLEGTKKIVVDKKLKVGDKIASNIGGTDADLIATANII